MKSKKILIIEDDVRIAQNIQRGLLTENFTCEIAFDGITGRDNAIQNQYDLVLLDINLPEMNGTEVCKQIRMVKPALPIIMLTAYGEIEDKVDGLETGANDYIVKPFDFRELTARINAALRVSELTVKNSLINELRFADLTLNQHTKEVVRAGVNIELTAKEFALLEYFMLNRGRVISKMDLAEHVWHLNFDPGTNVVEVYINYLRKKIDKEFNLKLIHTRPGLGYIMKLE